MASTTISTGLKARMIQKTAASNTVVPANSSITFDFETAPQTAVGRVGVYAGHPNCIITNIWKTTEGDTIKCSIFNPTDTDKTLQTTQSVKIVEIYY